MLMCEEGKSKPRGTIDHKDKQRLARSVGPSLRIVRKGVLGWLLEEVR